MKVFSETDLHVSSGYAADPNGGHIICSKSELIHNPPDWMKRGLQETASGYGKRLNSGYSINWKGRIYRIYVTIFSNSGSCWFKPKGRKIWVDAN